MSNKARAPVKDMSVGDALDEWFRSRLNTIGLNTERDYRLAIEHQIKPFKFPEGSVAQDAFVDRNGAIAPLRPLIARHLGGPARAIDPTDTRVLGNILISRVDDILISEMRNALLAEGLSVKRVNNLMAPLRGAIERQVLLKNLDMNPFDLVAPLRKALSRRVTTSVAREDSDIDALLPEDGDADYLSTEGEPDPFNVEEITAIVRALDTAMANQVLFSCWTGLRTGELIGLRRNDLQLARDRILVRRSLSRGILKTTKTDNQRWVDLLRPAKSALLAQLDLLGAPNGWVFPNPFTQDRWANESKITKRWRKALANAGVRYRRPYQLRHTFASLMLSAGENPLYVAQQMGHADWSMLVKVYGRWMPTLSSRPAGSLVSATHAEAWRGFDDIVENR